MKVEKLHLELTRMCTIECEHCFRGERRNEFMSINTIDNIFKDVSEVEFLLLTGGEPLLALRQIKELLNIINKKNIKIDKILLVTNCTVLNNDIITTLNELSNDSDFYLRLSYDMFHYIELNRLNLLEKRKENADILKEKFNALEYSDYTKVQNKHKEMIYAIGKAANLTLKRLDEINVMGNTNYDFNFAEIIPDSFPDYTSYVEEDNELYGIVTIDVNGNVVSYSLPFDEEDREANVYDSNVNKHGLLNASLNYIKNKNQDEFKKRTKKICENIKNKFKNASLNKI
ncbi:MAG: radical SAM protein [Bacilli bacterium]|nr:radical SAM protein [Bacilli bacterium]